MTKEERRTRVKCLIEEDPGIHHNLLCETIDERELGAKRTAERTIRQLLERREIVSFTAERRKCYMLASDEAYKNDLKRMLTARVEALKVELDSRVKRMEEHSYEAQQHLLEGLCGDIEKRIKDSDEWVLTLDTEKRYSHRKIGIDIRDRLRNTKMDSKRNRRVHDYSERVVSELERLTGDLDEMTKRKRTTRASAEKDLLSGRIRRVDERMHVLYRDTLNLESALKDMQSLDVAFWQDSTETGRFCTYFDSIRERSSEEAKKMSDLAQKIKEAAAKEGIAIPADRLNERVSGIEKELGALRETVRELETTGTECDSVARLDTALSEAESHLE